MPDFLKLRIGLGPKKIFRMTETGPGNFRLDPSLVLPNTPTEEFENVLFWTFNQSGQVEYAMDFGKSDHFESSGVISFLESKADLNKFFKPSLIYIHYTYRLSLFPIISR